MKIETQFKPGRIVYFMDDNVIKEGRVKYVDLRIFENNEIKESCIIEFFYSNADDNLIVLDMDLDHIFESIDALIKSLMGNILELPEWVTKQNNEGQ